MLGTGNVGNIFPPNPLLVSYLKKLKYQSTAIRNFYDRVR